MGFKIEENVSKRQTKYCKFRTVFARSLFWRIGLKDIFSMLKNRDFDMIYLQQKRTKRFRNFARVLFSRNSASAKFREKKKPRENFLIYSYIYSVS